MLTSAAFSLYPIVLPAVNPANSLTIYNTSASQYGLTVGLIWWSVGIALAVIYFIIAYRRFSGKVTAASSQEY
jgi:cytochrome d ubiquinol oxidase subunit II